MKSKKIKSTLIYFSGEGRVIEDFMVSRKDDFPAGGVLLSYWVLRKEKDSIKRMNNIIGDKL